MTVALETLLQNKLHQDIPISQYMAIQVVQYQPQHLILSAPLAPNINHRLTAFGGSITSLATLCCWGLIYLELHQLNIDARIVIQEGATKYLSAIEEDFRAECRITDLKKWKLFLESLKRKGIGRVKLDSQVICKDQISAEFNGDFVAKVKKTPS